MKMMVRVYALLQYFHFALSEMASVAVMSSELSQWESAFHLSGNVFSYLIRKEARLISNSMDFLSLLNENSSQCTFLSRPWLPVLSLYSHPLHRLQIKCVSDYFLHWKRLWKWAWSHLSSPPQHRCITAKWD